MIELYLIYAITQSLTVTMLRKERIKVFVIFTLIAPIITVAMTRDWLVEKH